MRSTEPAESSETAARQKEILLRAAGHPLAEETTPERLKRMAQVACRRLGSVTVVLENLWDPHNFSAIVRSAEGLGLCEAHVIESLHRYRRNPSVLSSMCTSIPGSLPAGSRSVARSCCLPPWSSAIAHM